MSRTGAGVFLAAAGFSASLGGLAGGAEEPALLLRPPEAGAVRALDRLQLLSLEPVQATWNAATGRVASISGRFPLPEARAGEIPGSALRFLAGVREAIGWDPQVELRLASRAQGIRSEHLRFAAFLEDTPIAGAEVAVHADLGADPPAVNLVTSSLAPGIESPAAGPGAPPPAITLAEAIAIGEQAAQSTGKLRRPSQGRLEIIPLPSPGRLAYRVRIDSVEPRGAFIVRVEAATGEALATLEAIRYGPPPRVEGAGNVFRVSPPVFLRTPSLRDQDDSAEAVPEEAYTRVILRDLDGEGGLTGAYVSLEGTPSAVRRVRLEYPFLRDHDGFEEVMIYYHIDTLQRLFQSLGFLNIYNRQIRAYANAEPPGIPYTESQAYFLPGEDGEGELAFGSGGVDFAEDPEVIAHEYGHAIQNNQVPDFGQTFDSFPFETYALGEGFSDWLSAAYLSAYTGGYGDLCLGEWAGAGYPFADENGCFRRLDSTKHYPEAMVGEPHEDGEMWAASLWQILGALGRQDSLRLVLQSHFYLTKEATFAEAASAVLRADSQLFSAAHLDIITEVFTERGFLTLPVNLDWFRVTRHTPPRALGEPGQAAASKIRIDRPGAVAAAGPRGAGLEVLVRLLHPFPGGVAMTLRSPAGTAVTLNDSSARYLPGGPLVFGREIEASGDLGVLAGEPIAGVWTLFLEDTFPGSEGQLVEWGLRFQGFVRGDPNADGRIDITDAIRVLLHLFDGRTLACVKAADLNDDGALNILDALRILFYLTGRGPPPESPFPEPGEDLTPDRLSCDG